ncbi:lysine 6-aminotransferase [Rhodanobacter sp. FW510-R12]|uniref:aminotransferase class III-fold pyridoxal phosphate-dependent enzyme n=1 Tax=unclassified Rhodanobacter TaxID=2621553 RepID=UPI0007A998F3|nr:MULTISPECIES: aminotransferase class III-fold pyridoxal phosphate-dependent enzyme [unclassified Rhodanobacter]KZC16504.1 lysine 6-aminotransferase [Rhodanobacter sp. FW104-R8]KZC28872.1 lysine 6-aminotransferase [Rhodanobacter sp. FW510-T8]KZC31518.1 lysine 6-aminotransferase [Rhodanobacter sp. FW510-R10]
MGVINQLRELREFGGKPRTTGLGDAIIERMAASDPLLSEAIAEAVARHRELRAELGAAGMADFLKLDETEQLARAQAGFVNFYPDDAINPYLPAAARGPWIVTLKGAVVHDNGGYGMLGFGHNNPAIEAALARPQVMANVMTPSVSQLRFTAALNRELGRSRGGSPYARYLCLNSGSESVSLACRIADVNAKAMTDAGGRHAGRTIKRLAVKGAFHGRTEAPALYSDSSRKTYQQNLASYRHEDTLITVEPYSVEQLKAVFADADKHGWFIEAMFLEPVMGEGDPGRAVTPEFYKAARALTESHGTLLLVDSIQAGLRAHGVLSFVDYPGFEGLPPPDMETFSKALNAGQYPLSVLAVGERAAGLYRKGIYGNTMTANPRALDVALATLGELSDQVRSNIRERGKEFVDKLNALKGELGGLITKVQGTGLLFSCELAPEYKCYGTGSTEEYLREHGVGVIHGGINSLRFTPHFNVTSAEIDLIVAHVRKALLEGPRKAKAEAA